MKRILIFGASDVGALAKRKLLEEGYEVLAFADNDKKKWGTEFEGLQVIAPSDIDVLQVDYVAIGLYKHISCVREQLIALGIDEGQIIIPVSPDKKLFYNERYTEKNTEKSKYERYSIGDFALMEREKPSISDNSILQMRIEDLKRNLLNNNIPFEEVCVCGGAVYEAYGKRESNIRDDLDIIMTDRFRKLYGKELIIVSDEVEVHKQNNYRLDAGGEVIDDAIIWNSNYHIIIDEIKFIRLGVMEKLVTKKG